MLEERVIRTLEEMVGKENLTTHPTDMLCYSYDATQQSFLPDVVVFPADTEQISLIVKLANAENVPVYPRVYRGKPAYIRRNCAGDLAHGSDS
jgi:glycolate oxidase